MAICRYIEIEKFLNVKVSDGKKFVQIYLQASKKMLLVGSIACDTFKRAKDSVPVLG